MVAYSAAYAVTYVATALFPLISKIDKAFFALDAALTGVEAVAVSMKSQQLLGIVELAGWAPLPLGLAAGVFMKIAKTSISVSRKGMYLSDGPHVSAYDQLPRGSNSFNDIDAPLLDYANTHITTFAHEAEPAYSATARTLFENRATKPERAIETQAAYPKVTPSDSIFATTGLSWQGFYSSTRT